VNEFYFLTIHPSMIETYAALGVFGAATTKNLAAFRAVNLRDFAVDRHGTVDGHPYGGGEGMVLRCEPLRDALANLPKGHVISLAPSGKRWTQTEAKKFASSHDPLIFVCGRFAGVDQRFLDQYVDQEYSLGDFVISGGELAALTITDSIIRMIPGVLGNAESAHFDSFSDGLDGILEYPLYTRPQVFEGQKVPEVLLSGDHKVISEWRKKQSLEKTKKFRPDLLIPNEKPKI